ncbi:MAG: fibro-slime domain-containing protein [Chitinispirillaceae bacterium]|nr:fibro-slime domain-containing protein [Chitinispirillaceae bacterium]
MRLYPFSVLILLFLFPLLSLSESSAQTNLTIHILNPWRNDTCAGHQDSLLLQGDPGAGLNWSPGKAIFPECGGWFYYSFSQPSVFVARIASFCGPDTWQGWVERELSFNIDTVFGKFPQGTKDIWISIEDSTSPPVITARPPDEAKFIYFLSAWSVGAPRVVIDGCGTPKMIMDTSSSRCGWFKYAYFGAVDSVQVKFMNSFDSTLYSSIGMGDGGFIDLSSAFQTSDTAWVLPSPPPLGPPEVYSTFPNYSAPCERTISLRTTLRDYDSTHPDFGGFWEQGKNSTNTGCWQEGDWGAPIPGMLEPQLNANERPVLDPSTPCLVDNFNWFTTETVTGQYTNAKCYDLELKKNSDGLFEYDTGFFFPADGFHYLDDNNTVPNPRYDTGVDDSGSEHNYYFTVEVDAQFKYLRGQTFYFRGDDDVWVFINNQLVVDLGGIHNPMEGSVNLDTLGLTAGHTYDFKMFFCERNMPGSSFRILTSINLTTSTRMFWTKSIPADGQMQFDIFERISRSNLSCGAIEGDIDTINAEVAFFIEGPQFTESTQLSTGLSYGGIYISDGSNVITLDTTAMTGLETGFYTITFQLLSDPTQRGQISFTITKPPKPDLVVNPVVAAAFYADNGIGQVNRAEIYYTNPLVKLPDSVVLFWPEPINTYRRLVTPGSGLTPDPADSRHITAVPTVPFDPLTTIFKGTTSLGTSYIFDTTFQQPHDVTRFDIADSVGPLLMSALMQERTEAGPDTFYLTFSEAVDEQNIAGPSLILKTSAGEEIPLTVTSFSVRLDTIVVITEATTHTPVAGDSLRIAPEGPLTDQFSNHAHRLNRAVSILIRKAAPKVIDSWYSDRNADGVVDTVSFRFDRPLDREQCSLMIGWIQSLSASGISGSQLVYGSDDSTLVSVDFAAAVAKSLPVATSGVMSFRLSLTGPSPATQSGNCTDSAAAVLTSAEFHPAPYDSVASRPDTLTVTFSEPVPTIPSGTPLVITRPGNDDQWIPHLQIVRQQERSAVFIITSPVSDAQYPMPGDSAFINPAAGVAEVNGVLQSNPANRRVQVKVLTVDPHFVVTAGPNPFDPLREAFGIRVDPFVHGRGLLLFRVNLVVYDKVGSLVAQLEWPPDKAGYSSAETVFWNGVNHNGRVVGNGTYLGVVKITGDNGILLDGGRVHRIKIGVKNSGSR